MPELSSIVLEQPSSSWQSMTDIVPSQFGALSLTLHSATLPHSLSHSHSRPVAVIHLPYSSQRYQSRPAFVQGGAYQWNDGFDFAIKYFDGESDSVSVDVVDIDTDSIIGHVTVPIQSFITNTVSSLSLEPAGSLSLTAVWTVKNDRGSSEKHRHVEQHGRFLVSDDEVSDSSNDSDNDSTDDRVAPVSSSSSIHSSQQHSGSISGTASTDIDSATTPNTATSSGNVSKSASTPSLNLLDRRSDSQSPALPDDTYSSHNNRHVSSFLPSLTQFGLPSLTSSGRYGLLYDDSTIFDDRNFLGSNIERSSICEIHVWSRDYIHGIQIVYAINGANHTVTHVTGPRNVGRVHTTEHVVKFHHSSGEYLTGIEGTYKEWLETLTIVTNKRSHTFGGNVDHRATKWQPQGTAKKENKFSIPVPLGHRIYAFTGGYGVHLHNIGVHHGPVSVSDLGRKRGMSCVFAKLKKKLSSNKLDKLEGAFKVTVV